MASRVKVTRGKYNKDDSLKKVKLSTDYKSIKYVQVLRNKNKEHYGMD